MDGNQNYRYESKDFFYEHRIDAIPDKSQFVLHNHNDLYEILLFIRGNSEFKAEGSTYILHPYDVIITHSNEMHMMCHIPPVTLYERVVIHIRRSFFAQNDCEDFLNFFTNRPLGVNNLIPALLVEKENILNLITDFDRYLDGDQQMPHIVAKAKLIELLYRLSRIAVKSDAYSFSNEKIKNVITYINDNITSELSLDNIAEHSFISKYHLCHLFKKYSGLTINQYIHYKRILMVRNLVSQGWSLIDASTEAGFGNYSNFYKTYVKEMGKSPQQDMQKQT